MKFSKYLRDKLYFLIFFFFVYFTILLLFLAFKIDRSLIIVVSLFLFIFMLISLFFDYFRKRGFYNQLLFNIEKLDKSYLVLETLNKPNFYEGELLFSILYEINKSMVENVKNYEIQENDFKEYIEMWIHEVKIPISSLLLMVHNHKNKFSKRAIDQIRRIENDVEQVLYYTRSENAEKDYLIKKVSLNKVVTNVALKNKDDLLENKVDLIVDDIKESVYTDSKWLEFILNQIINNSIKYKKEKTSSYIKVFVVDKKNCIVLIIEDNGIGIPNADLPRVFDKSFTGYNGRIKTKSTGMGLNICKNLCEKLGHKIEIVSVLGEYTKVSITFYKNNYYEVVK